MTKKKEESTLDLSQHVWNRFTDLNKVFDLLNESSSTNEKIEILKHAGNVRYFKQFLKATYNPYVSYFIKKIPAYDNDYYLYHDNPWSNFFNKISILSSRSKTGNEAITHLERMFDRLPNDQKHLGELIIKRDLKCGVSAKTINKAFPGLIDVYENMLCETGKEKNLKNIIYPCVVQEKADGMRINGICRNNGETIEFRSRSGKVVDVGKRLEDSLSSMASAFTGDFVLDGELLVVDEDGNYLDRKISNGICNKALKGTIEVAQQDKLQMVVWDVIPLEAFVQGVWQKTFKERSQMLATTFKKEYDNIVLINHIDAQNAIQMLEYYNDIISKGGEGVILKNLEGIWEAKRSKDFVKMKVENTADLIILEVAEGAGRLEGMLGKFVCATSDGELTVGVGSGFTDAQREEFFTAEMKGKIVEVKYNEIISKKGSKTKSLFLPIFVRMRNKKKANKLGELK